MNQIQIAPQEITDRVNKLKAICVSKENAKSLEAIRTETNNYIKSVKFTIEEAKKEFLKPFAAVEEQALAILNPLEEANREFSDAILTQKKAVFFEKVMAEWEYLTSLDPNGNVAPFQEVYDPSWYGKPEKVWKPALASAIKKYVNKGERTTAYFVLEGCTYEDMGKVEAFLIENKIAYRKENL